MQCAVAEARDLSGQLRRSSAAIEPSARLMGKLLDGPRGLLDSAPLGNWGNPEIEMFETHRAEMVSDGPSTAAWPTTIIIAALRLYLRAHSLHLHTPPLLRLCPLTVSVSLFTSLQCRSSRDRRRQSKQRREPKERAHENKPRMGSSWGEGQRPYKSHERSMTCHYPQRRRSTGRWDGWGGSGWGWLG